jgi:hypothetical protein
VYAQSSVRSLLSDVPGIHGVHGARGAHGASLRPVPDGGGSRRTPAGSLTVPGLLGPLTALQPGRVASEVRVAGGWEA